MSISLVLLLKIYDSTQGCAPLGHSVEFPSSLMISQQRNYQFCEDWTFCDDTKCNTQFTHGVMVVCHLNMTYL